MQPSLSTTSQPEPDNRYPDCLYMELEGIPVEPNSEEHLEFWTPSTQKQQVDLLLSLKFNQQWESLDQGRVKFGLKGGELRLKLENSEIPYESRQLVGSLELYIPIKGQQLRKSQTRKRQEVRVSAIGFSSSASAIASSLNSNPTQTPVTVATVQTSGKTAASVTLCHVSTKVTEENPVWIFEEETGEFVLKGLLNKAKLATLNIFALPCHLEATFAVSQRDVCLTDAEGLWPPDISRNKRAVLDRLIIQRLLEPKLKPYLSRAELHYE